MERTIKLDVLKLELPTKYILDVRRTNDRAADNDQLPGATESKS